MKKEQHGSEAATSLDEDFQRLMGEGAKAVIGLSQTELAALPAYLAGCYPYKRSNRLWHFLIKRRLVRKVWRPLVELTRLRHVAFRKQLEATSRSAPSLVVSANPGNVIPAGV